MIGTTHKKALILLESGALTGDTRRQLCLRAYEILDKNSTHALIGSLETLEEFHNNLSELNKAINKANKIRTKRKKLEDTNPSDYQTLKQWQALDQQARLADNEEVRATKEVDQQASTLLSLAQSVLATEGIDIITYEAADMGSGGTTDANLKEELSRLANHTHYGCIVLGGGHGSTDVISGLTKKFVQECVLQLNNKNISGDLVCLGSCESATHARYMQTLLQPNGMVLGYLGDSTNNFAMSTINYQLGITDEFIEVDLYDDNTEATAKAAALSMLYKNEITAFELSDAAVNETNSRYWADSFNHLFIEELENQSSKKTQLITTPTIDTISILGAHTDDAITPMNALLSDMRTRAYVDGLTVNCVDSTLIISKVDIVKRILATLQFYEEATIIEELMDDNQWTESEAQEYLERLAKAIPTIKLVAFSNNTQDRLTAVNTAIAHIIPPQNGIVYNPGLMTTPIAPELAERSLQVTPGKLKDDLLSASSNIKTGIKLRGY